MAIKESIGLLSDREKKILSLRFLAGRTQTEVAEEIGISQAQISRLEKNAIRKIKELSLIHICQLRALRPGKPAGIRRDHSRCV